jgi:phosphoglycolate phosphatase
VAISCVLFDFDGTLVPNLDLAAIKRSVTAMSVAAGVPASECAGRLIVEIVDHSAAWLRQHGADAQSYRVAAHRRIREMELAAAAETQLFPGVRELFGELRTRSIVSGIVTRNCEEAVRMMFPDLNEYCDALFARDHVEHLKPDRRHLLACLDALERGPHQAVMVGDGLLDMRAGRELSMLCVGVSGPHDEATLRSAGADHVIEDVTELLSLSI